MTVPWQHKQLLLLVVHLPLLMLLLLVMAVKVCFNRHLLLLLSPKADTYFTVPERVEG